MKITVINGTEKHGVTYHLKELFLAPFKGGAHITEYYLPQACPGFCTGCVSCVLNGEDTCKDAQYIQKIADSLTEADLIVMTSPAYVFHTTGAMKTLLDHLAYRWMPHRPVREMFGKRAVIITQCLGMGAKGAANDIRHSLSWWGVSEIGVFTDSLMSNMFWDTIPEKKRAAMTKKISKLARRFANIDYSKPAGTSLAVKFKFYACRLNLQALYKSDPEYRDAKYWAAQGWLAQARPWK